MFEKLNYLSWKMLNNLLQQIYTFFFAQNIFQCILNSTHYILYQIIVKKYSIVI